MLVAVAAEGSREWSSAWPEASVSRSLDKGNAGSGNEVQTCQTVKQRSVGIFQQNYENCPLPAPEIW